MPTKEYKVNGKIYDIPESKIDAFEKRFPNALVPYEADGKKYDIPVSKRDKFLVSFKNAQLGSFATVVAEPDTVSTEPNTVDTNAQSDSAETTTQTQSEPRNKLPFDIDGNKDTLAKRVGLDKIQDFNAQNLPDSYNIDLSDKTSGEQKTPQQMSEEIENLQSTRKEQSDAAKQADDEFKGNIENGIQTLAEEIKSEYPYATRWGAVGRYRDVRKATRELQRKDRELSGANYSPFSVDYTAKAENKPNDYDEKMSTARKATNIDEMIGNDTVVANSALHMLSQADKTIQMSKSCETRGIDGFFKRIGAGLKGADWENMANFGTQDLMDAINLYNVLGKINDNPDAELSKSEIMLVNAMVYSQAVDENFQTNMVSRLARGIPENLSYMLTYGITAPIGAPAGAAARKLTEKGIEKIFKGGLNNLAERSVETKGLRYFGQRAIDRTLKQAVPAVVGATVAAGVQSLANPVGVATGTFERMAGTADIGRTEDNMLVFNGMKEQANFGNALRDAYLSTFVENLSERSGQSLVYMFNGGRGLAKAVGTELSQSGSQAVRNAATNLADLASMVSKSKFGQVATQVWDSSMSTTFSKIAKAVNWNGTIEEFYEEQVGTVLNAMLVGDDSIKDLLNGEQQLETFLSVALIGGIMRVPTLSDNIRRKSYKSRIKADLDSASKSLPGLIGEEAYTSLQELMQNGDASTVSKYISNISKDWSEHTCREVIKYVSYSLLNSANASDDNRHKNKLSKDIETEIDARTNKETGNIVTVETTGDKGAIDNADVIDGRIVFTENGTVNTGLSDRTVVIRHTDGTTEMVSPQMLGKLVAETNAEEFKQEQTRGMLDALEQQLNDEYQIPNEAAPEVVAEGTADIGDIVNIKIGDNIVDASINSITPDGDYVVNFDEPVAIDGYGEQTFWNFTPQELARMQYEAKIKNGTEEYREVAENDTSSKTPIEQMADVAAENIPADENGKLLYEEADVKDTSILLLSQNGGDKVQTIGAVKTVIENIDAEIASLQSATPKVEDATDIEQISNARKEVESNIGALQQQRKYWTDVLAFFKGNTEQPAAVDEQPQQYQFEKDKNGVAMYHKAPVEETVKDLRGQGLDESSIAEFAEMQIDAANTMASKLEKSKLAPTNNPAEFMAQKKQRVADIEIQNAIAQYWAGVKSVSSTSVVNQMTDSEIEQLIANSENNAIIAPEIELTPDNWEKEFGNGGIVTTPIGNVKIGENQYLKLAQRGRDGKLGMIKPTLTDPDFIVEDKSLAKNEQGTERESSFVFVRSFIDANQKRQYHFTSVTVRKDGAEVVISNQEKSRARIARLIKSGLLPYIKKATLPLESVTSIQGEQQSIPNGASSRSKSTKNIPKNKKPRSVKNADEPSFAELQRIITEPNSIEEAVLLECSRNKFYWKDKGVSRGLGTELGFVGKEAERRARISMLSNDGTSVDRVAEYLAAEGISIYFPGMDVRDVDFKSDVVDAMRNNYSPKQFLMRIYEMRQQQNWEEENYIHSVEAQAEHERPDEDDYQFNDYSLTSEEQEELDQKFAEYSDNNDNFEREKSSNDGDTERAEAPTRSVDRIDQRGHSGYSGRVDEEISESDLRVDSSSDNRQSVESGGGILRGDGEAGGYGEFQSEMAGELRGLRGEAATVREPAEKEGTGYPKRDSRWSEDANRKSGEESAISAEIDAARKQAEEDIDARIADKRKEVGDLKTKYERKKKAIGKTFNEDKQGALFADETKQSDGNLFDVARDYSRQNMEKVLGTMDAEYKTAAKELQELEASRGKFISDAVDAVKAQTAITDNVESANEYGAENTIFTKEDHDAALKELLDELKGTLNAGFNPKLLSLGIRVAGYHIEAGARKFADYVKAMNQDFAEAFDKISPYLKTIYKGVRGILEVDDKVIASEMDTDENIDAVDIDKVLKDETLYAEKRNITKEQNDENTGRDRPIQLGTVRVSDNGLSDSGRNNERNIQQEPLLDSARAEQGGTSGDNSKNSPSDEGRGDRAVRSVVQDRDGGLRRRGHSIKNTRNNRNERGVDYAPKSPKARFKANIEAIKLMKQLAENEESATDNQKEILRKFSGWGGLGSFFNSTYTEEYRQLRDILTEEELQDAKLSINSAYYTPAQITDTLWDIAQRLGFTGGNILEGSAGVGNIIGSMPQSVSDNSSIQAVELDSVSGNILKLLYPDAKVDIQGFQDADIENGSIDLAITNVPFVTGLRVFDAKDKDLSTKFKNIHDFCIAKNIRKLRQGGYGIFITSNNTLDKSRELRDWIIGQGSSDVIGAFRLNNETFNGTPVTSDIIVVRKRIAGEKAANAIDISSVTPVRVVKFDTGEKRWNKKTETYDQIVKDIVVEYNEYFYRHPNNMAGTMKCAFELGETYRPETVGLYPSAEKDQTKLLTDWVASFNADAVAENIAEQSKAESKAEQTTVKEGGLTVNVYGEICTSSHGQAIPLGVNANKVKGQYKAVCLADYNAIKSALADVLEYQRDNLEDTGLQPLLDKLNRAYDKFFSRYGSLNKNTAIAFLRNDVDFASTAAVEEYKDLETIDGKKSVSINKTDVFKKRVLFATVEPQFDNVKDGVRSSVNKSNKIDVQYIATQLNRPIDDVQKEIIDSRLGFVDPISKELEIRYVYLSGNVREKLEQAKQNNHSGEYNTNIESLMNVLPKDIPAHLISIPLGATWIDTKFYYDFIEEKYGIALAPDRITNAGGMWLVNIPEYGRQNEKNYSEGVHSKVLNKTIYGDMLFVAAMNNQPIQVSTTRRDYMTGKSETIVDKQATEDCCRRADEIKDEFALWAHDKLAKDEELAERTMRTYNDKFNAIAPKTIDDTFLFDRLPNTTTKSGFELHDWQKKAIIRCTLEPLMVAHGVGRGKSYTLISAAMEMRRLGMAKKPMIVVQNSTVGQFVTSAKFLYPSARILTISENDHAASGRLGFYAKIKYNDWDIIIIPQSVFNMIPDSFEKQQEFIQEKIDDKLHVIETLKNAQTDKPATSKVESELKKLQEEYTQLSEEGAKSNAKRTAIAIENAEVRALNQLDRKTDNVEYFDDMEIDALLIDEAHEYKHLGFATTMQRGVKGIDPSDSKKAAALYIKTRTILRNNGWKNVVFATGTPISNTAAEIWTFMKYLMPEDALRENDIFYFDDFVKNFGRVSQFLEFATNGKFKENTRFASYVNLPELVRLWSSVSDMVPNKNKKEKNEQKKREDIEIPEIEGGHDQDIYLPQSSSLVGIMRSVRRELARYESLSPKEKKQNSSLPLVMFGIAKRAAIDPRLVQADSADEPLSKTNRAIDEICRSLSETSLYKGTVAVFCDNYRRWDIVDGKRVAGFNLFNDIKDKLIKRGIPANQIYIMRSGMTNAQKEKMFADFNSGKIRVAMGNTQTLGTGVNIQERLHTLIHMDAPARPMDYTQRNGRILRQGNLHAPRSWDKPVRVLRFGVEDSLDVTAYQRLQTKENFINSIMDGAVYLVNNQENRTLEEEEDGVFDNPVAVLSGSVFALKKQQAEREYRKYVGKKRQYEADQIYIFDQLRRNKGKILANERRVAENEEFLAKVRQAFPDKVTNVVEIDGVKCTIPEQEEVALKTINKSINEKVENARSNAAYNGEIIATPIKMDSVDVTIFTTIQRETVWDNKFHGMRIIMHRDMSYTIDSFGLNDIPASGQYVKGVIDEIRRGIVSGADAEEANTVMRKSIEMMQSDNEQMESRKGKPFEFDKDLKKAAAAVEDFTAKMKAEIEAKEAKYAEVESKTVDVDKLAVEDAEENDTAPIEKEDVKYRDIAKSPKNAPALTKKEKEAIIKEVSEAINYPIVIDYDSLDKEHTGYVDADGTVHIIVNNCKTRPDVIATILHELVGHKGVANALWSMRGMCSITDKVEHVVRVVEGMPLSESAFSARVASLYTDLMKVLPDKLQRDVAGIMKRNGWSMSKAVDEVLAREAEKQEYIRPSLWKKICARFRNFWRNIFNDELTLNDNDIKYMFWRAYQSVNKTQQSKRENDADMRRLLGIGSNSIDVVTREYSARDDYESLVGLKGHQFIRKWVDHLNAVKTLQNAVAEQSKSDIRGFEDVESIESLRTSRTKAVQDRMREQVMVPMLRQIALFVKNGATIEQVRHYMMAKHGLERNEEFRCRQKAVYDEEIMGMIVSAATQETDLIRAIKDMLGADIMFNTDTVNEALNTVKSGKVPSNKSFVDLDTIPLRDCSGLTALAEFYSVDKAEFTENAQEMVTVFENQFTAEDIEALWDSIRTCTRASLDYEYDSGLLSKETYEKIRDMYKYYIPLRSWDDGTTASQYEYTTPSAHYQGTIKTAKGRKSLADDPIAYMLNMLESSVVLSEKNRTAQALVRLAMNHKSDLLIPLRTWYVKTIDDKGHRAWQLTAPDIPEKATGEAADAIIKEFETRMRGLQKHGDAVQRKGGLSLDKRVLPINAQEHYVSAKINGQDYVVVVNGNPKAAQMLNNGSDAKELNRILSGTIGRGTRLFAKMLTTYNPMFVVTNLNRDVRYSVFSSFVKEGAFYTGNLIANMGIAAKSLPRLIGGKAISDGTVAQYFKEFVANGGETGFTSTMDVEAWKLKSKRLINQFSREKGFKKGMIQFAATIGGGVENMNRWAEDVSRFAAYMTSRKLGRSITESVSNAKEVSVNFNRHGSGGYVNIFIRNLYAFSNAAIQGLSNIIKLGKDNPKRFAEASTMIVLGGLIEPMLNIMLIGAFGDDDDWRTYQYLTDFNVMNRSVLFVPGGFLTIPIPQELSVFHSIGSIYARHLLGWSENQDPFKQVSELALSLLPFDFYSQGEVSLRSMMPTVVQPFTDVLFNENFYGSNIYREYDYGRGNNNDNRPEFTKAYRNTSPLLVKFSKALNEATGGDEVTKGWADGLLTNPAVVEHLIEGYTGGPGRLVSKTIKTGRGLYNATKRCLDGEGKFEDELLNSRFIPFVSSVYSSSNPRNADGKINELYRYYTQDLKSEISAQLRGYQEQLQSSADNDTADEYAAKLSKVYESVDYQIISRVKEFDKSIKNLDEQLNNAKDAGADKEYISEMEANLRLYKLQMLQDIEEMVNENYGSEPNIITNAVLGLRNWSIEQRDKVETRTDEK